jgi:hypothetical protein
MSNNLNFKSGDTESFQIIRKLCNFYPNDRLCLDVNTFLSYLTPVDGQHNSVCPASWLRKKNWSELREFPAKLCRLCAKVQGNKLKRTNVEMCNKFRLLYIYGS